MKFPTDPSHLVQYKIQTVRRAVRNSVRVMANYVSACKMLTKRETS